MVHRFFTPSAGIKVRRQVITSADDTHAAIHVTARSLAFLPTIPSCGAYNQRVTRSTDSIGRVLAAVRICLLTRDKESGMNTMASRWNRFGHIDLAKLHLVLTHDLNLIDTGTLGAARIRRSKREKERFDSDYYSIYIEFYYIHATFFIFCLM